MTQFTSSTKPLLSFAETELIKKLVSACGDRLAELTQMEKYQLSAAITIHLWGCAEDIEQPNDEGYDDGADDDLMTTAQTYLPFGVTGNVSAALFILKDEDPDNLASILPAIVSYAKEDDRLHD
jgi:hypothetical protein